MPKNNIETGHFKGSVYCKKGYKPAVETEESESLEEDQNLRMGMIGEKGTRGSVAAYLCAGRSHLFKERSVLNGKRKEFVEMHQNKRGSGREDVQRPELGRELTEAELVTIFAGQGKKTGGSNGQGAPGLGDLGGLTGGLLGPTSGPGSAGSGGLTGGLPGLEPLLGLLSGLGLPL